MRGKITVESITLALQDVTEACGLDDKRCKDKNALRYEHAMPYLVALDNNPQAIALLLENANAD